jgi:pimeloyl-ACP methyl ester carboxylesterase
MPTARVNGSELFYQTQGSGDPLLLIAGFACDQTIWSLVLPALAARHRVIVFDNRGVGRSSAPEGPYTIAQMAADAAGLLDAVGSGPVHVAGHSMGGQIALELALAQPQRVRSLALLCCAARNDERGKAIIEAWGELPRLVDAEMGARLSLPWIYTSAFYARPGAVQQRIAAMLAYPFPPDPQGLYHQSRAVSGFDALDRLGRIRCPTLVLAGGEDILIPVAFSEELARGIAGAQLVVLPRTGHGLLIESPDAVAAAVLDFLSRQPAG